MGTLPAGARSARLDQRRDQENRQENQYDGTYGLPQQFVETEVKFHRFVSGNRDAGQPTRNDHLGGTPLPRTHQDRHTTKRSRAAAHANDQLARRELRRGRLGYDALGNPRGAETTPSRSTLLMRRSLEPLLPGG